MYLPGLVGAPFSPMDRTLKRARRTAPAATKRNAAMSPAVGPLPQRPLVDEQRPGATPKEMTSARRVDLQAEGALRLGQPRDATVEHVEEQREHEQQRGPVVVVVALGRGADADGVEPAEHARERDDVGQEKQRLAKVELAAGRRQLLWISCERERIVLQKAGGVKKPGPTIDQKLARPVATPYACRAMRPTCLLITAALACALVAGGTAGCEARTPRSAT